MAVLLITMVGQPGETKKKQARSSKDQLIGKDHSRSQTQHVRSLMLVRDGCKMWCFFVPFGVGTCESDKTLLSVVCSALCGLAIEKRLVASPTGHLLWDPSDAETGQRS